MQKAYISFNRPNTDMDADVTEFLENVKALAEFTGYEAVISLEEPEDLRKTIGECAELWQCFRSFTDESKLIRHELPGAIMWSEKNTANALGVLILEKSFICKF